LKRERRSAPRADRRDVDVGVEQGGIAFEAVAVVETQSR
jgi:hypothetical protein